MNQIEIEFFYEHPVHSDYACDEKGNVYSMKWGKIRKLKPGKNKKGYLVFDVFKDGKRVAHHRVNRFVWECIKGEIPDGYDVDHLDFNRQNNCIENLLARPARDNRARLSEEGMRRISKPVIQLDLEENFIAEFSNQHDASRQTGVARPSISRCCKGKLKSAGGFKWKDKEVA